MAKNREHEREDDADATPIAQKRAEKEARESLFADIEGALEHEWEAVEIPQWGKDRKFWLRGATLGERTLLLSRGFRTVRDAETGDDRLQQTTEYVPVLIATCLYWDNPESGQRERVFNPRKAEDLKLINRHRGAIADPLVRAATKLSGLGREAEEEAREGFLATEDTDGFDSDSLVISE